ncbi:TPA_asm: hypothetical protein [ssRNA phage Gerhypos.2_14]|uniref:Uncharacterized protein n=2 Tax=Fiersviridae TaxID=2842319 RepID=A0A8S5KXH5_9VIRU|nr:hypothetical protein QIL48_gp2 [ssRNA phage Gerhypos.2_14]QDH88337.1 MAG: hypothetical protein H2Bulk3475_000003 [Leviviridae sp.]DAD50414.1 TPA_asm: hypothetical protein [ssRNA phage Gerhypos.2_14]
MAKPPNSDSNGALFYRQLLKAQYDAYMKVAIRKHGLSSDMLHRKVDDMTNEEVASAVSVLRDLAHLPPE